MTTNYVNKHQFCKYWFISRPHLDRLINVEKKISVNKDTGKVLIDLEEGVRARLSRRVDVKPQETEAAQASSVRTQVFEERLRSYQREVEMAQERLKDVRDMLEDKKAELQRALEDKERYRKEAEQVKLITDERDQAQRAAQKAEEDRNSFKTQVKAEFAKVQEATAKIETEREELEHELKATQTQVASQQAALEAATADASTTKAELEAKQAALSEAKLTADTLTAEIASKVTALEEIQAQADELKAQAEAKQKDVEAAEAKAKAAEVARFGVEQQIAIEKQRAASEKAELEAKIAAMEQRSLFGRLFNRKV